MKSHTDYTFYITFNGNQYKIDVVGVNVSIEGYGMSLLEVQGEYEVLRKYIEDEGFIVEIDRRKGILDLFKTKKDI
jgi:hypothetical protein